MRILLTLTVLVCIATAFRSHNHHSMDSSSANRYSYSSKTSYCDSFGEFVLWCEEELWTCADFLKLDRAVCETKIKELDDVYIICEADWYDEACDHDRIYELEAFYEVPYDQLDAYYEALDAKFYGSEGISFARSQGSATHKLHEKTHITSDRSFARTGSDRSFAKADSDRSFARTGSDRSFSQTGSDRSFAEGRSDRSFAQGGSGRSFAQADSDRSFA